MDQKSFSDVSFKENQNKMTEENNSTQQNAVPVKTRVRQSKFDVKEPSQSNLYPQQSSNYNNLDSIQIDNSIQNKSYSDNHYQQRSRGGFDSQGYSKYSRNKYDRYDNHYDYNSQNKYNNKDIGQSSYRYDRGSDYPKNQSYHDKDDYSEDYYNQGGQSYYNSTNNNNNNNFSNNNNQAYNLNPKESFEENCDPAEKYLKIFNNENQRRLIVDEILKNNPELEQFQINSLIRIKMMVDQEDENEYQFQYDDLYKVFQNFGNIQKVIVKEKGESYIQYEDFFSAYSAQKALNGFVLQNCNIRLSVQLCLENPEEGNEENVIGNFRHDTMKQSDFIIYIKNDEDEENLQKMFNKYTYTNKFQLDITDEYFELKDRILGASGSNLFRLIFLCEKNATQKEIDTEEDEIIIKLIQNERDNTENELIVLTNNYSKYECALRHGHELLAQIVHEHEKYCLRSGIDVKTDVHIKRIEKFNTNIELQFKDPKTNEFSKNWK